VAPTPLHNNTCSTCAGSTTACGLTTTSTTKLTVTNASNRVADLCLAGTCTPTVLTTGIANLILITPGAATSNRAGGWPTILNPISSLYFADSENSDNNDYNCFIVPTSTSYDRDRIYVVQ
jgi:hypothetical protein